MSEQPTQELAQAIDALADTIGASLEAMEIDSTLACSALVTCLMRYSVAQIRDGNTHIGAAMRKFGAKLIAIADAKPEDVEMLSEVLSDSTAKH